MLDETFKAHLTAAVTKRPAQSSHTSMAQLFTHASLSTNPPSPAFSCLQASALIPKPASSCLQASALTAQAPLSAFSRPQTSAVLNYTLTAKAVRLLALSSAHTWCEPRITMTHNRWRVVCISISVQFSIPQYTLYAATVHAVRTRRRCRNCARACAIVPVSIPAPGCFICSEHMHTHCDQTEPI